MRCYLPLPRKGEGNFRAAGTLIYSGKEKQKQVDELNETPQTKNADASRHCVTD
jgi:hypothetical protein